MSSFIRVALNHALLAVVIGSCSLSFAQQKCPTFKEISLNGKQSPGSRFATFPGGFVMLAKELATDTDGASTAYHPDNIGSTHLCNGFDLYRNRQCVTDYPACYEAVRQAQAVHWNPATSPAFCVFAFEAIGPKASAESSKVLWGAGLSNHAIPVQGASDAAPGFFISMTASPVPARNGHGLEYADADRLPYLVMPGHLTGKSGPTGYRNAGAIVRLKDSHKVYALVADENDNPAEVSVAASQLLHDPALKKPKPISEAELRGRDQPPPYPYKWYDDLKRAKVGSSEDGPYLVFALGAKYGRAPNYDPDLKRLEKLGDDAFSQLGGLDHLTTCARQFFRL
ncbi:hypothetical protein QCE73_26765 [Caballeronia sp. LZ029]|uniref:hypothetical protein n=1 Tax=Caballeronia sp. LZ029 TaxID=3038564 RepID=UPI002859462B|nr:hypothetical protein [Caballeronia sp. LZ029]MDR5746779.1 hypothetical protein [Caballeronia sp. LZ029]